MTQASLRHEPCAARPGPPKILAAAADGIVRRIEEDRGDADAVFARAEMDASDLDCPTREISLAKFVALFEGAAHATGNDNFGLRFGYDFAPRRLGPIGYVTINSPTLLAGVRNLIRYFPAHQENSVLTLEEDRGILWLAYQIVDPRIPQRRQDAELSLGMFCNVFWHALGRDWAPIEVHFEHPAPDDAEEHRRRFRAPVSFSRRTNAIALRPADLEAAMPGCDPYLFKVIEPFLAERRDMRLDPDAFVRTLSQHIRLRLGEAAPRLSDIAESLGMSPWTLQRRLKRDGVAFADLVKAARRDLALRYVRETDLPLTEVALALGYSELSAFSRAFRVWTGLSPQRYRRLSHA